MAEATFNATVVYRNDITSEQCILRIAPDTGVIPEFEAGQYAEIAIPTPEIEQGESGPHKKFIRRAYSIASPPDVREYVEFYVVLVEDGELTPKLWPQPVGGKLWLGPKLKGKFTLRPIPPGKDLIMISSGTGLAPFISMLRQYQDQNRWRKAVVIHSVYREADLGYRLELEELAKSNPSIVYLPTLTREPAESSWPGLRGRAQLIFENNRYEQLVGSPLDPENCHVLLCGNPSMIESMQALFEARGFQEHSNKVPGNLHFERYW